VLALAGVAAFLAWRQYTDGTQAALNDQRARAVLAAQVFDTYFSGELGTLETIAKSPVVVDESTREMRAYFRRVQPPRGQLFKGGLGWVDRHGIARVSTSRPASAPRINVSGRSYFRAVVATHRPFVSEGLRARIDPRKLVVTMAVPTFDRHGRLSGVLAGALLVKRGPTSRSAINLGYRGLAIFDRKGQSILAGFAHPPNAALVRRLGRGGTGVLADTHGFDGQPGHVVAWATAKLPSWTIAVDRPRSALFSAPRHSLELELALVAGVVALMIAFVAWVFARSRRDARRQHVRAQLRTELARTLGGTTAVSEVSDAVASAVAAAFPTVLGVLALTVGDDGRLHVTASAGPLPPFLAGDETVLTGIGLLASAPMRMTAIETRAELRRRLPELDGAAGGNVGSAYVLGLGTAGAAPTGALLLLFERERGLARDEQALIASHAEQAARALERARVHEREHAVAVTLQKSLLSESLPHVDGLDLAARYEAGSAGLEVGGDWYDVVTRPDGIVIVTVGDVAGRGITAAVLMGRLRNASRAYAWEHASPSEVLRRLGRHVARDEMATAVCLAIDPYAREVAYASAGHLPPVLVDVQSEDARLLEATGAPPLGAVPVDAFHIPETRIALPAQAILVAYTDGLIERRGEPIDQGIELVSSTATAMARLEADEIAEGLLAAATQRPGQEDDTALLVIRLVEVPSRIQLEIPADARSVSLARNRVHAWLRWLGVDDSRSGDAVLAVSEACNNVVEHAYAGDDRGTIRLALAADGATLQIVVEDAGRWRPDSAPAFDRGRGLPIMHAVMDRVEIERRTSGTCVRLEQRLDGAPLTPAGRPLA
jgi:serine phosphatase RsbU (regulator of sigma subunit)/anti-sigma regulatory factor (Ser/Thr protein kinase)